MSKKVIAMIMAAIVCTSLAGCSSNNNSSNTDSTKNTEVIEEVVVEGTSQKWSRDFTLKDFTETTDNLFEKVVKQTKEYGLEYTEDEVVRDDNEKTISVDNKEAEKNRLQNMYFSRILYGDDLSSGQIKMKILLNFDGESAIKDKDFDLGSTSIAKYSEILTGVKNRDYSKINAKILELLNSSTGEGYFKSSIEGLNEEITVTKEYIVYSVETTKYEFTQSEQ